jgi:hypothetical protein
MGLGTMPQEPVEQRTPADRPKSHEQLVRETEAIVQRLAELNAKSRQLAHQNQALKRRLEDIAHRMEHSS